MDNEYVFIDIEATSLEIDQAQIIEIAIITYHNDRKVDEFSTLIKPKDRIPSHIYELTGISNKMCKNQPEFYEVANKILDLTQNKRLIAHNILYDYEVLKKHFLQLGIEFQAQRTCTLALAKNFIPGLESYSLKSLANFFSIRLSEHHRALSDAKATREIYKILRNIYYPRQSQSIIIHPSFKNLHQRANSLPCLISLGDKNIIHEDSKKVLEKYFSLNNSNTDYYKSPEKINFTEYASLIELYLKYYKNKRPKWVLFNDSKRNDKNLFIGKFDSRKRARFSFLTKTDALFFKKNKISPNTSGNLKISSEEHLKGLYTHIFIKDFAFYAIIKSKKKDLDLIPKRLDWYKLSFLQISMLHLSMYKVRRQIIKTDRIQEVKEKELVFNSSHFNKKNQAKSDIKKIKNKRSSDTIQL